MVKDSEKATLEWLYVVPWGVRKILNYVSQKYATPIYVTENGMDDEDNGNLPLHEMLDDKRTFMIQFSEFLVNFRDGRIGKQRWVCQICAIVRLEPRRGTCYIQDKDSWHWKKVMKIRDKFRIQYLNGTWNENSNYTIRKGYAFLIGSQQKVIWSKIVWNSAAIPKHCFIFWLAVQDRLKTKSNLLYAHNLDPICVLCAGAFEDREQLFFHCPWSKELLGQVCDWLGVDNWRVSFLDWVRWLGHGFRSVQRQKFIDLVECFLKGTDALEPSPFVNSSFIFKSQGGVIKMAGHVLDG
ncbi:hypothetical protein RIF29_14896 [Crotalaria pallida]|uniref:Reverse transcriptase zinc-binding domain-containing protein n=1 Tax=Crotalaria pallida TaxID=3830 RepID=A0AAN9IC38_CROPI